MSRRELPQQGSNDRSCMDPPTGDPITSQASASSIRDKLSALLELAREPLASDDNGSAYQERLSLIADNVERLIESLNSLEPADARLQVTLANIKSAASDASDVETASSEIWLNASKFNLLAFEIQPGTRVDLQDLTSKWARYQRNNNPYVVTTKIKSLVSAGIFILEDDQQTLRRSPMRIILKGTYKSPTPLFEESEKPSAAPGSLRLKTAITTDMVLKALSDNPALGDPSIRLSHAYGRDSQDTIRFVAIMALDVEHKHISGIWSPPLNSYKLRTLFFKAAGCSPRVFKDELFRKLLAKCLDQLSDKLTDIALRNLGTEPDQPTNSEREQLKKALVSLALNDSDTQTAEGNQVLERLGLNANSAPKFVNLVLAQAKLPLFEILNQSPIVNFVGARALEAALDYAVTERTLQEIGRDHELTRQRIDQLITRVRALDPLIGAIVSAPKLSECCADIMLGQKTRRELEASIRRNPEEAYKTGKIADPNPSQLEGESISSYHKRIFLAAFAGRYIKGRSSRNYPLPLRTLGDNPGSYFRNLAFTCANSKIRKTATSFKITLERADVQQLLSLPQSPLTPEQTQLVMDYIQLLVNNPEENFHKLWQRATGEGSSSIARSVYNYLTEMTLKQSKERAQAACRVLAEPWFETWRLPEKLRLMISTRIVNQLNVSQSCSRMDTDQGRFSAMWGRLVSLLPAVALLSPRPTKHAHMRELKRDDNHGDSSLTL